MLNIKKVSSRFKSLMLFSLIATWQLGFAFSPLFINSDVDAAPVCVVDTGGVNDTTGGPNSQVDLTKLCVDYAGAPTSVTTTWNWDNTGTSGSNTMDACSLFDTDNDGNINYAVCVTTQSDPASLKSYSTYSCGDAKPDGCTNPVTSISSGSTVCTVSQATNDDPFAGGSSAPKDTQASCTVQLSTVGGASAKLVDVCSYPSSSPTSNPNDCIIAQPSSGKIEVIKNISPASDSGLFNLSVDGPGGDDKTVANQTHNGSTGEVVVSEGVTTVSETAGTNTSLANYTTTIVCRNLNGTGSIVAQGTSTSLAVNVADDADIVCVITNTRLSGTITLIKNVIRDNNGNAGVNDFGLSIGGTSVNSGQTLTLSPGSYAIDEAGLTGYSFAGISGDGCPSSLGENVNLQNGQNITCTITNDDQPGTLTVNKTVINDNGGGAEADDFSFKINNDLTSYSFINSSNTLIGSKSITVNAGSYSVTENNFTGYEMTSNDCSNIVVTNGGSASCSITNNDLRPTLTLYKQLGQTFGSNVKIGDWVLEAIGSLDPSTDLSGTDTGLGVVSGTDFKADTYTLSESSNNSEVDTNDFTAVWVCEDVDEESVIQLVNLSLTLSLGQRVSCTVTNTGIQPKLTVVKVVKNDNGGTKQIDDFPLVVEIPQSTSTDVKSGETNNFDVGTYQVGEMYDSNQYSASFSGDCDSTGQVTLELGDDKKCTITNDDIAPKLTIYKKVVNDNSGTAMPSDWTMTATPNDESLTTETGNGYDGFAGREVLANQTYSLSEEGPDGYDAQDWQCSQTTEHGEFSFEVNQIRLSNGVEVTCTITNNDIPNPSIKVEKSGPATAKAGDSVTYTFKVTNDGDIDLNGVTLVDDIAGKPVYQSGDTNNDNVLSVGETWLFSIDYVVPLGQSNEVTNTATACAYPYSRQIVSDEQLLYSISAAITPPEPTCNWDTHTLEIPQVLAATTPATTPAKPAKLVETGTSLQALQYALPVLLITLVGMANRRKATI